MLNCISSSIRPRSIRHCDQLQHPIKRLLRSIRSSYGQVWFLYFRLLPTNPHLKSLCNRSDDYSDNVLRLTPLSELPQTAIQANCQTMTGIMGDRKPSNNQPTSSSKGRKRKHSEMMKAQLEALKQQNGLLNLIDLVQGPGSTAAAAGLQAQDCAMDESAKPNNDLILASKEVGQALNSLLDQLQ